MIRPAQASAAMLTLIVVLLGGYFLSRAASGMRRLLDGMANDSPGERPTTRPSAPSEDEQREVRGTADDPSRLDAAAANTTAQVALPALRALPLEDASGRIAACDEGLRLLGSVVNAAHPHRSLAAVEVRGGTRVLRTGERIGDSLLVSLGPRRAYLRDVDGTTCMLRVTPEAVTRPAPARPQGAAAARRPALTAAELTAGIRSLGGDNYAVSRSLLERALGDPAALRRSARLQVVKKNGRTEGIRLSRLRAQSPLTFLGLQKGDVVRKLNGFDLADPAGALEALAMLKSQSSVSLALLRGGQPRTLTYAME
jgi:type II secretory pathway component PulC